MHSILIIYWQSHAPCLDLYPHITAFACLFLTPPPALLRYVVLFFYPLDFTFVCPTEIAAFNEVADQLAAMSVACSHAAAVSRAMLTLSQEL